MAVDFQRWQKAGNSQGELPAEQLGPDADWDNRRWLGVCESDSDTGHGVTQAEIGSLGKDGKQDFGTGFEKEAGPGNTVLAWGGQVGT